MSTASEQSTTPASIGRTVREARLKRGWTQDDLAAHAQVSRLSVIRLENGNDISTATLSKVAIALGLTLMLTD